MKFSKKDARIKRARKFRMRNRELNKVTLCVHKSSAHIYAQIIDGNGANTLASVSSVSEKMSNGGNIEAATKIGALIAKISIEKKIKKVTFDRSGFQFHGRVKALAQAARENGLEF